MTSAEETFYAVTYREPVEGKIMTVKVKKIADSSLGLGFIKLSDFRFKTNPLLVNPAEENLRKKLENVKSLHLNIYSILSIEEIGMENSGLKFDNDRSNLVVIHQGDNNTNTTEPRK